MADSKRQDIIDEVLTVMQTITTGNGYNTDIGTKFLDFHQDFQEDELPAGSVMDVTESVDEGDWRIDEEHEIMRLNVHLRVWVTSGTRSAIARQVIADIVKAVGTNQRWNDGTSDLALKTELLSNSIILAEDGFRVSGVNVEIDIYYVMAQFDPYNP